MPTIGKAWVRAAPPGASVLAGYATVRNDCSRAFVITGVGSTEFASSMIHETLVDGGVSKMRHVESVTLSAGGEVRFAPGGRHLMLMNPKRRMKVGEQVRISLKLKDGRLLSADFPILAEAPN